MLSLFCSCLSPLSGSWLGSLRSGGYCGGCRSAACPVVPAALRLHWQVHVAKLKCCVQRAIVAVVRGCVGRLLHSRMCWYVWGTVCVGIARTLQSRCLFALPCHECTAPGPRWPFGWEAWAWEELEKKAIVGQLRGGFWEMACKHVTTLYSTARSTLTCVGLCSPC